MDQPNVLKMREYFVDFPFFILHDWGKRSAETRSSHLSGVASDITYDSSVADDPAR